MKITNFLLEKYLSNSPEERIGRVQFILRFILILGMATIIWVIISPIIQLSQDEIALFQNGLPSDNPRRIALGNLSWVLVYGFFYYVLYTISSKRYVDIGWTSRTPKILISTFFIVNLWSFGIGAYAAYFGNPVLGLMNTGGIIGTILWGAGWLMITSFACVVIMVLLCIILPGMPRETLSTGVSEENSGI